MKPRAFPRSRGEPPFRTPRIERNDILASRAVALVFPPPPRQPGHPSAVVGSMMRRTRATEFAGNPPIAACFRTAASSGAMYTQ